MLRILTTFLLVFVATTAAANLYWHSASRVKRSVDDHAVMRVKRDADSSECLKACFVKMDGVLADKKTELSVSGFDNPFFDKSKLFADKTTLPSMCEHYKATKLCADECSSESQVHINVLEYLCVTHFDEYNKYADCYLKNDLADNLCVVKCGTGANDIISLAARTDKLDPVNDFGEVMNSMGQVCKFTVCTYDCERPNYVDTCNTTKPVDLMHDLTALIVNGTFDSVTKVGLSSLLPIDCKVLTGAAPKQSATAFSPSGSNDELERTKLQLEIDVLNKQSNVLDAQIENLKLEKQLFEKQLA